MPATKGILFGLMLLGLAGLSAAPALAKDQVPDWVKTAAADKVLVARDAEAVVLFEETTLNVQANGKATERVRRVVRLLRPQARE